MKPATYAPVYCSIYPDLAEVVRSHGYALAIHGSLQRDFDLICIPWADEASKQTDVIKSVCDKFALHLVGDGEEKPHGRVAYTLIFGSWGTSLDLSFMPLTDGKEVAMKDGSVGG